MALSRGFMGLSAVCDCGISHGALGLSAVCDCGTFVYFLR